jgi:hypothetical protein
MTIKYHKSEGYTVYNTITTTWYNEVTRTQFFINSYLWKTWIWSTYTKTCWSDIIIALWYDNCKVCCVWRKREILYFHRSLTTDCYTVLVTSCNCRPRSATRTCHDFMFGIIPSALNVGFHGFLCSIKQMPRRFVTTGAKLLFSHYSQ